jgi:RNAse (barnase) inhibitor barstar
MGLFRTKTPVVDTDRLDFRLLQNGAVVLYHRAMVLTEDIIALTSGGYRMFELDAQPWAAAADMYRDVKRVLAFPDYFGNNLASLIDGLTEMKLPKDAEGIGIVIRHFDTFAKKERDLAQSTLDALETASRHYLLHGKRMLALVQSDDPGIRFERVGARPVCWNPREWLDESRKKRVPATQAE